MVRELTHFIGGKHVSGQSGRFADVYDPNVGQVQARVPLASRAEVAAAVADAALAQPGWAATNPQRRARVMMRFLDLVNAEHGRAGSPNCSPASTARPSPTPKATSSVVLEVVGVRHAASRT